MSDTIAAIATGNVLSAIGILRLSGDGVLTVIDRVFRPANGRPMSEAPDRKLVYGAFCDTDGQTLDLCLCTVSRAPHSYTGEDTAELQCHGSPAVLRAGLQALFAAGARQALAGENVIGDALYFYAPALSQGVWINANCTYQQTIGCHRFYL